MPSSKNPPLATAKGLRAYVKSVKSSLAYLPLIHITDVMAASQIFAAGELSPRRCPHFSTPTHDEHLVYLSYGRPSYRSKASAEADTGWAKKPVAFVFRPDAVANAVHRVFPFDTGAYFHDIFKSWIKQSDFPIDDFELEGKIGSTRKVVKHFFGSNNNYFKARVVSALKGADPANFSLSSYLNLINAQGSFIADDRRLAIEVQLSTPLQLTNQSLQTVIIPDDAMDSVQWKTWARQIGIKPEYYLSEGSFATTSEWDGILRNKTLEFLGKLGS